MGRRSGTTLVELLIVIAILMIATGLLLPAVQGVRETVIRAKSQNQLRQIALACHGFAVQHAGSLPSIDGNPRSVNAGWSLWYALMPHAEMFDAIANVRRLSPVNLPAALYVSPADMTALDGYPAMGFCSYAANAQAFQLNSEIGKSISDGTANTIAFAEHYSLCQLVYSGAVFNFKLTEPDTVNRRATFADQERGDVYPIMIGGQTAASVAGQTFQIRPGTNQCDSRVAQTPHPSGMLIALFDGSVRTLRGNTGESVYWSLVTPNGGEAVGAPE